MIETIDWRTWSEAFAFAGNSFLKPLSQTPSVGLDPAFWDAFPHFGSDEVAHALSRCRDFAALEGDRDERVAICSVEYTRLFVGPPEPAAAPWETMYCASGAHVGFGRPTFEMKRLLRDAGLELSGENRQYEDHLGIELLYLSARCERAGGARSVDSSGVDELVAYVREHPLSWIDSFADRIAAAAPEGYYERMARLAAALLRAFDRKLSSFAGA